MMVKLHKLVTKRLLLRQWQPSDCKPFAQLNADPRVMAYLLAPLTAVESNQLAQRCHSLIADRGWGLWATELQNTGQFIGYVGLHSPTVALPFGPCVEIGWRLAFAHWGQGYATEAAQAALAFGFQALQLPEIVSFTSVLNHRSEAVMKRLGMVKQPDDFEHPAVPAGHRLRRHCLYKLKREQWLCQQHPLRAKFVNNLSSILEPE